MKAMETAFKSYQLLSEMADKGNPASISDVGVGALATRACIEGAAMNVRINLAGLKDEKFKSAFVENVRKISADSEARFKEINHVVEKKLG
jgi:glutamate formiminotransferase/formiminotetrahydrofolate cyclodeaminase